MIVLYSYWDTLITSGFRSNTLAEQQHPTSVTKQPHMLMSFLHGYKNLISTSADLIVLNSEAVDARDPDCPPVSSIRSEIQRWPRFQLAGSRGSSRLFKKRKALVMAQAFSPCCHKTSPDTKPSHSSRRRPTALPINVTSFHPLTRKLTMKTIKEGEKNTSTNLFQLPNCSWKLFFP